MSEQVPCMVDECSCAQLSAEQWTNSERFDSFELYPHSHMVIFDVRISVKPPYSATARLNVEEPHEKTREYNHKVLNNSKCVQDYCYYLHE